MAIRRILDTFKPIVDEHNFAPQSIPACFFACGCGRKHMVHTPFASQNWREVRLDIDSAVQPDVIGTMTNMKSVDDASVDAVFLIP